MKYVATVLCVLFTLFQGGFSDSIWAGCGILAVIALVCRMKTLPPLIASICMAVFLLTYVGSVLYHGLSYEALAALTKPVVACLLLLVFYNVNTDATETLFFAGITVAAIGYIAIAGFLPSEGQITSNRLQGVFQYANATGIFLSAGAFMTRLSEKRGRYAPFLECALLLTQSVGSILVYIAGWTMYLIKNRHIRPAAAMCGFGLSLLAAGVIYTSAFVVSIPPISLLPPIALIIFSQKISHAVEVIARQKWVLWVGGGLFIIAAVALLFVRASNPIVTYLDRLVQISDGLRLMLRYPLGIGPGAWQFHYPAYQSAHFYAAKIHSEYVSIGVNAGILAVMPLLVFLGYWLKHQKWEKKAVCAGMLLLHAVLDIPFSFLPLVFVTAMLFAETLPKSSRILPTACRGILILPLVLFVFVFASSAVKNQVTWIVRAGDSVRAAEFLEKWSMRNDTDAVLTRMALYAKMGEHDQLDKAFSELTRPNAVAHSQMARSLIHRERYEDAAAQALMCAEQAPYSPMGYDLMEQILPQLHSALQADHQKKIAIIKGSSVEHPLFTYKKRLMSE